MFRFHGIFENIDFTIFFLFSVFKRIFAPKLKSGNNTDRKGQVEIEIKSKSDKKDEVDEDEMRVSQQLPRIKDHQKIHHSSNKKDYYSEKVDNIKWDWTLIEFVKVCCSNLFSLYFFAK